MNRGDLADLTRNIKSVGTLEGVERPPWPPSHPAALGGYVRSCLNRKPIRQVFQSDGENAIWRFESSHPSHADVSEWQ